MWKLVPANLCDKVKMKTQRLTSVVGGLSSRGALVAGAPTSSQSISTTSGETRSASPPDPRRALPDVPGIDKRPTRMFTCRMALPDTCGSATPR